jgi:hypothetical protein
MAGVSGEVTSATNHCLDAVYRQRSPRFCGALPHPLPALDAKTPPTHARAVVLPPRRRGYFLPEWGLVKLSG